MSLFGTCNVYIRVQLWASAPGQTQCDQIYFIYSFFFQSDPQQWKSRAQKAFSANLIFFVADFTICANSTSCPFLPCTPALSLLHPFSSVRSFPRTSSINIRVNCQHITVASVASMHSFTSASEQTVEAAENGNILLFTGQWMFSPLALSAHLWNFIETAWPEHYNTVIEVYCSLFNVTLWKRRHAVALP